VYAVRFFSFQYASRLQRFVTSVMIGTGRPDLLERLADAAAHIAGREHRRDRFGVSRQKLQHLGLRNGAGPHAEETADHLHAGIGSDRLPKTGFLRDRIGGARLAVHHDHVAFAVEFLGDPLAAELAAVVWIGRDIEPLRARDRRIDGHEQDALVVGVLDAGTEAGRGARIAHDDVAPLSDLRLELRDLEIDVAV
jgi:hypothetical protein